MFFSDNKPFSQATTFELVKSLRRELPHYRTFMSRFMNLLSSLRTIVNTVFHWKTMCRIVNFVYQAYMITCAYSSKDTAISDMKTLTDATTSDDRPQLRNSSSDRVLHLFLSAICGHTFHFTTPL